MRKSISSNVFEYSNVRQKLLSEVVGHEPIRVSKKTATRFLLENEGLVCGGIVFYCKIWDMGLGIYGIQKAPITQKSNLFAGKIRAK